MENVHKQNRPNSPYCRGAPGATTCLRACAEGLPACVNGISLILSEIIQNSLTGTTDLLQTGLTLPQAPRHRPFVYCSMHECVIADPLPHSHFFPKNLRQFTADRIYIQEDQDLPNLLVSLTLKLLSLPPLGRFTLYFLCVSPGQEVR